MSYGYKLTTVLVSDEETGSSVISSRELLKTSCLPFIEPSNGEISSGFMGTSMLVSGKKTGISVVSNREILEIFCWLMSLVTVRSHQVL